MAQPRQNDSASPRPLSARPSGRGKTRARQPRAALSRGALRARKKFLRVFPGGFRDQTYLDWERDYKWNAHRQWEEVLGETAFADFMKQKRFQDIAAAAIRIESRTNL